MLRFCVVGSVFAYPLVPEQSASRKVLFGCLRSIARPFVERIAIQQRHLHAHNFLECKLAQRLTSCILSPVIDRLGPRYIVGQICRSDLTLDSIVSGKDCAMLHSTGLVYSSSTARYDPVGVRIPHY